MRKAAASTMLLFLRRSASERTSTLYLVPKMVRRMSTFSANLAWWFPKASSHCASVGGGGTSTGRDRSTKGSLLPCRSLLQTRQVSMEVDSPRKTSPRRGQAWGGSVEQLEPALPPAFGGSDAASAAFSTLIIRSCASSCSPLRSLLLSRDEDVTAFQSVVGMTTGRGAVPSREPMR